MTTPSERTILITGATDGLGREVATQLAAEPGTTLLLHGRNRKRLDATRAALEGCPARLLTVCADFSELAQVRRLCDEVESVTDRLTVLVNNAGVGFGERRVLTADGNELGFAVNYLAPFLLTQRLLPLLDAGAPARVVNVAAAGQSVIDFDDLTLSHGYSGRRSSGQSKLALIAYGFVLAAQLDPRRVTVNSLHPATFMPTKIVRESVGYTVDSLATGAQAVLRLIRDPALAHTTGQYFDGATPGRALPQAYDPAAQQRLWSLSNELTSND